MRKPPLISYLQPKRFKLPRPAQAYRITLSRNFRNHDHAGEDDKRLSVGEGQSEQRLRKALELLLIGGGGQWRVSADGKGLQRSFRFKTFNQTWRFMSVVAKFCKEERHHPEWSNVYNRTFIRWTTHNPEGLSLKDTKMAAICDEQARLLDELPLSDMESGEINEAEGHDLLDQVRQGNVDCCKK